MRTNRLLVILLLSGAAAGAACTRPDEVSVRPGAGVRLDLQDGVSLAGEIVEVAPEHIVIETAPGKRTRVPRARIARVTGHEIVGRRDSSDRPDAAGGAPGQRDGAGPLAPEGSGDLRADRTLEPAARADAAEERRRAEAPDVRQMAIPSGTVLPLELTSAVGSDTSAIEDTVRGRLRRPVVLDGVEVLPAGTVVTGHVTAVERAGRVKGRARVAFRFTRVEVPGDAERLAIRTEPIVRLAPATKKQDAAKIGGGAAGGAIIGGILGGGDGAAKGAAIGGAAGTGVVLSTRGREVRLAPGTPVMVRLSSTIEVRVPRPRGTRG